MRTFCPSPRQNQARQNWLRTEGTFGGAVDRELALGRTPACLWSDVPDTEMQYALFAIPECILLKGKLKYFELPVM